MPDTDSNPPSASADAERDAALRQLEQVFEASPNAIVCIDRQWNIAYANGPVTRQLGASPVGKNLWRDFPGALSEPYHSHYWKTMVTRQPVEFEANPATMPEKWLRIFVRPFTDGIIVFTDDISTIKQAERRREATARQLQRVFDATSDAILMLDREWRFIFLNRRAEDVLAPRKDFLGRVCWEVYPELVDSDFHPNYHRAMDERVSVEFEAYSPVSNRWFEVEVHPTEEGVVAFFHDVTGRHLADDTMRRQQEVLNVVQQAARAATFDMDIETGAVSYGPGSFEVYGRPHSELSTIESLQAIRAREYDAPIADSVARAIATLEPQTVEFEIVDPDGSRRWLESRFQAIPVDGAVRNIRGIAIDIGERKRNEAVLVASEARYRALTELNPQAIWMADAEGNITYANQVCQAYTGVPIAPDGSSGEAWLAVIAEDHRDRLIALWSHSIATGEDYDIEVPMRRSSDGAMRWWRLRAQAVRDEADAISYWLGIGTDIDEARQYAETLRRQHEETERQRAELESIYETAPVGLALFDPDDFRYLRLNERQAQIVGLPKERILGRTLTEIAPIEGLREMFERVAAGTPIRNQLLEGELPMAPGEHRFWTVNYFPVYAPDGSVQAITAASLEITNQKKAEAALIQSEKLAAVGRLASSISHEINNPLEAVTNLLYLLALAQDLPEELRVYVNMAQSEISRVSQIATQTLRFHRQAVRPTAVAAADLVQAVLNLYQGRLANSGIAVETRFLASTPILCFENDIRQVLNNLIANSIDAMRTGGRLIVRAHNAVDHASGQTGVRIVVADTGHGMSAKVRERIFEPFYTTKDLNGTGLGLWISGGIVQRHHGRLSVSSSEHPAHHGTVFSLFLPCEAPEQVL